MIIIIIRFIIKTGIYFGVDYCLYRSLPSECHSEICILIIDATSDNIPITNNNTNNNTNNDGNTNNSKTNETSISNPSQLDWKQIASMTRVMPVIHIYMYYIINIYIVYFS
jgi:hypothetical protein